MILLDEPWKPTGPWDYPSISINEKLDFKEPEFTVEYILTEALITYQRGVFIQLTAKIKEQMESEYFLLSSEVLDLWDFWNQLVGLGGPYNSPETLLNRIDFAITLCKETNVKDLIEPLKTLKENLEATINPLISLRNKVKKETIKEIFKRLSQEYIFKNREIVTLNYENQQIKDDNDYFTLFFSKIRDLIWNYKGIFELIITFSSKDVADEVDRYFQDFSRHLWTQLFNFVLVERTSNTTFSIKNEATYLYIDKERIEENLSRILNTLITIMQNNHNKLLIQTVTAKDKKFFKNLQAQMQREFDNSNLEKIWDVLQNQWSVSLLSCFV